MLVYRGRAHRLPVKARDILRTILANCFRVLFFNAVGLDCLVERNFIGLRMRLEQGQLLGLEGCHRQAQLVRFISYLFLEVVHFVSRPGVENIEYIAIILLSVAPLHSICNVTLRLIYRQISITPDVEALPIRVKVLGPVSTVSLRLLVILLAESLVRRPLGPARKVVPKRQIWSQLVVRRHHVVVLVCEVWLLRRVAHHFGLRGARRSPPLRVKLSLHVIHDACLLILALQALLRPKILGSVLHPVLPRVAAWRVHQPVEQLPVFMVYLLLPVQL